MDKIKNWILVSLFILLIINIFLLISVIFLKDRSIFECPEDSFRYDKRKHSRAMLINKLELNKEQEEVFFEMKRQHRKKIFPIIDSVRIIRAKFLDDLTAQNEEDSVSLFDYAKQISEIETMLQIETLKYFLELKKILNPEQFEKLVKHFKFMCGCDKRVSGCDKRDMHKKIHNH